MSSEPTTIEEYISTFPDDVQVVLNEIHGTIRGVLPGAEETISYRIPTFKIDGRYLVYFAGFAKHVSIYPILNEMAELEPEIAPYRSGRATLKFPLKDPVPYGLIERVVQELLDRRQAST